MPCRDSPIFERGPHINAALAKWSRRFAARLFDLAFMILNLPSSSMPLASGEVETWWQLSDVELLAAYHDARRRFAEKKVGCSATLRIRFPRDDEDPLILALRSVSRPLDDREARTLDVLLKFGGGEERDVGRLAYEPQYGHGEPDQGVHFREARRLGDEQAARFQQAADMRERRRSLGDQMQHVECEHGVK